jgi:hypothetical protein
MLFDISMGEIRDIMRSEENVNGIKEKYGERDPTRSKETHQHV